MEAPTKPGEGGLAGERTGGAANALLPPGRGEPYEAREDVIWDEYERGVGFKQQLNLYDTVKVNEDFYVGKQWEGVRSNGLPTPVFNYIKRIILYLVASAATDNLKINASPLSCAGQAQSEQLCKIVNAQFEALFESNKMSTLIRQFTRNAAVDGDACLYAWFDPELETGQAARGGIRTELLENTRVIFGNPNSPQVQEQPWLIVSRRERLEDVRRETAEHGGDPSQLRAEADETGDRFDALVDGKVTTLLKLWRRGGSVWAVKTVRGAVVRPAWDTGQRLYPLVWMSWDRAPNCYHGQAAVTGLIPNQIFVNKMFAMTMISLMTTAYPKVVYDKTRIARWDSGVGKAIGVDLGSGSISDVAKTIDPAVISPQVSQFIELAVSMTKEFMGATDAALGSVRPDNTSAIVALQKASQVPLELTRQDLYQCVEDMGRIWLDLMRVYYGQRLVKAPLPQNQLPMGQDAGVALFDFHLLDQAALTLKLDVGGSAYWSEIAQMNTLDNLLSQGRISVVDYLERVPSGYISNQQELIDALKEREELGVRS
jgi:hypothetical protein